MLSSKKLIGFFLSFACAFPAHADPLRLLNWEEYLSPKVIELWQKETGVEIEEVYFDNDEKRDEILTNPDRHDIDVAVVDEVSAELFGKSGKFLPVNQNNVESLKHIDPFWRSRCGNYSLPYMWGTLGIAYRSDKVQREPGSWRDLMQPEDKLKGHLGMLDDYTDMLAPALFFSGYSLNTNDQSELKQAFELLKKQAADVLTYQYAISYLQSSSDADKLYMAAVYSGDQDTLNDIVPEGEPWRYVVPEEGTVLWVDCMAVVSSSKNKEIALKFINFLNRPEIAALNSEEIYVATANRAALPLLSEEFRNNSEVFPPEEVINRSQLYQVLDKDSVKLRQRITSAVRNIHDSK